MTLLQAIKELIFIAPSRCAIVFFNCDLQSTDKNISVKFYPTTQYVEDDNRFNAEDSYNPFSHISEMWHQTGMAVGSLEFFLTENNIDYTTSDVINNEYIEVLINV